MHARAALFAEAARYSSLETATPTSKPQSDVDERAEVVHTQLHSSVVVAVVVVVVAVNLKARPIANFGIAVPAGTAVVVLVAQSSSVVTLDVQLIADVEIA